MHILKQSELDEIAQINLVQSQCADWDNEEGTPVSAATAERAKSLLSDAALRAAVCGKDWVLPAISATPGGGIHFSWLVCGSRVTMIILSSHAPIVYVDKYLTSPSRRELVSDYEAVSRVMYIFRIL